PYPLSALRPPSFFFSHHAPHRPPPPSPTRRSSDLPSSRTVSTTFPTAWRSPIRRTASAARSSGSSAPTSGSTKPSAAIRTSSSRSEEHTSELQSLTNLVCRLLLDKKNIHHLHPIPP